MGERAASSNQFSCRRPLCGKYGRVLLLTRGVKPPPRSAALTVTGTSGGGRPVSRGRTIPGERPIPGGTIPGVRLIPSKAPIPFGSISSLSPEIGILPRIGLAPQEVPGFLDGGDGGDGDPLSLQRKGKDITTPVTDPRRDADPGEISLPPGISYPPPPLALTGLATSDPEVGTMVERPPLVLFCQGNHSLAAGATADIYIY